MPYVTDLELRLSGGYKSAFKHLNENMCLGSCEVFPYADISGPEDPEDMTDPICYLLPVRVRLDDPHPYERIKRAIEYTFSSSGCGHDYDCCGCRSYRAWPAKQVRDDLWVVEVHSSRNF